MGEAKRKKQANTNEVYLRKQIQDKFATNNLTDAIVLIRNLINLTPTDSLAYYNLGICLAKTNSDAAKEAYGYIKKAIDLKLESKHILEAYELFLPILFVKGEYESVEEICNILLKSNPGNIDFLAGLSATYRMRGRYEEALAIVNTEIDNEHNDQIGLAGLYHERGLTYYTTTRHAEAISDFYKAYELNPELDAPLKNIRLCVYSSPNMSNDDIFEVYTKIGKLAELNPKPIRDFTHLIRDPNKKLRIGFISSNFRMHVTGYNILPLFASLDRQQFEIYLYSDIVRSNIDAGTQLFVNCCDQWQDIQGLSEKDASDIMLKDNLDIVVYIAMSMDENRFRIAEYRNAPIQATWHDLSTSGLSQMDYWITDPVLHPIESNTEKCTEELYYIPIMYQYPRPTDVEYIEPPCVKNDFITFGSFNKPEKLNADVLNLWSKILISVPTSKLYLKHYNNFSNDIQNNILAITNIYGIDPARIIFHEGVDAGLNHKRVYNNVDIALDPFPFAGATTTFEALCAGIPVVTLNGDRFSNRAGLSMMIHAGYKEFVCNTWDDYITKAVELSNDHEKLKYIKQTMPLAIRNSPLCDAMRYGKYFGMAFRDMWNIYLEEGL